MKTRDLLTTIGAILYALGQAMKVAPPNATMFWLAQVFEGVGGTIGIGSRAMMPSVATEDDIERLQRTKVSKPKKKAPKRQ